eukprot:GHVL01013945.1.p2 GENE.GHVL01013945.1~~GHVL01013945.1.p2  ORF type:complete len:428 (-),score=164.82 GHVL01013945.1:740-2023(-)
MTMIDWLTLSENERDELSELTISVIINIILKYLSVSSEEQRETVVTVLRYIFNSPLMRNDIRGSVGDNIINAAKKLLTDGFSDSPSDMMSVTETSSVLWEDPQGWCCPGCQPCRYCQRPLYEIPAHAKPMIERPLMNRSGWKAIKKVKLAIKKRDIQDIFLWKIKENLKNQIFEFGLFNKKTVNRLAGDRLSYLLGYPVSVNSLDIRISKLSINNKIKYLLSSNWSDWSSIVTDNDINETVPQKLAIKKIIKYISKNNKNETDVEQKNETDVEKKIETAIEKNVIDDKLIDNSYNCQNIESEKIFRKERKKIIKSNKIKISEKLISEIETAITDESDITDIISNYSSETLFTDNDETDNSVTSDNYENNKNIKKMKRLWKGLVSDDETETNMNLRYKWLEYIGENETNDKITKKKKISDIKIQLKKS